MIYRILKKQYLLFTLYLIASIISGCSGMGGSGGSSADQAQLYLKKARNTKGTKRTDWLLLASESLLMQQRTDKAITLLDTINTVDLTESSQQLYHLLMAHALTAAQRTEQAFNQYTKIRQPELLKNYQQVTFYNDYADLLLELTRYYDSALQRISLSELITDPLEGEENRELLWNALVQIHNPGLYKNSMNGMLVSGWLELANLAKVYADQPDALLTKLDQWRSLYQDHPAYKAMPIDMARAEAARGYQPRQIALLLPQTGNLSNSAKHIRNGFMTAIYQIPASERPEIRFYDSSDTGDISSLYQKAVDQGASFVIGPLHRDLVEALAQREYFPVPVMSINRLSDQLLLPDNFYQFGLPVEDEVRQAAIKAWNDGFSKALVLVPLGTVGERTQIAFTEQFEQLGGEIQKTITYGEGQDYSRAVQEMLGVDKSLARFSRLEQILGVSIEHEARRRQDADMVFFKASEKQARRIKPFIDFYYAHDLPLYSTSSIYAGKEDPLLDKDLDNVQFCDIPWLLSRDENLLYKKEQITKLLPTATQSSSARLFALGYDLYTLIPDLNKLRNFPQFYKEGLSGLLTVDPLGHVQRRLTWAKFVNGQTSEITNFSYENNQ
ncbi:MAG: hypothetical protein GY808_07950 [Gammaproteobacteria bacterium]|nr:hypothetical protein [Gammaproteobacteria bacterium]